MIFFAKIKDGELQIGSRQKMINEIKNSKDGTVRIEITYANKRTLPQNAYFHAVLVPEFRKALNDVGYHLLKTDEQCKRIIKSMFLTRELPNDEGGKPVHYIQDTSELTKEEMTILINEVIQFASENCNYVIPLPGEKLQFDF